jgi:ABC-type transporter Mla MlaB component
MLQPQRSALGISGSACRLQHGTRFAKPCSQATKNQATTRKETLFTVTHRRTRTTCLQLIIMLGNLQRTTLTSLWHFRTVQPAQTLATQSIFGPMKALFTIRQVGLSTVCHFKTSALAAKWYWAKTGSHSSFACLTTAKELVWQSSRVFMIEIHGLDRIVAAMEAAAVAVAEAACLQSLESACLWSQVLQFSVLLFVFKNGKRVKATESTNSHTALSQIRLQLSSISSRF